MTGRLDAVNRPRYGQLPSPLRAARRKEVLRNGRRKPTLTYPTIISLSLSFPTSAERRDRSLSVFSAESSGLALCCAELR